MKSLLWSCPGLYLARQIYLQELGARSRKAQGTRRKEQKNHNPQSKHQISGCQVSGVRCQVSGGYLLNHFSFCLMPHAPCSMPHALCSMPYAFLIPSHTAHRSRVDPHQCPRFHHVPSTGHISLLKLVLPESAFLVCPQPRCQLQCSLPLPVSPWIQ